jgi:pimeloyl-ACP methyl ester carboxylesterase
MTKDTIILAHGLWMTGAEMSLLKRRLRKAGFHVVPFRYRMLSRSLQQNTQRFAQFIRNHASENTSLLGHSLGGVMALQTLQAFPDLPVSKVLCLGSPLLDTAAGRVLSRFKPGQAMLGKTLPEAVFARPLTSWEGTQTVGVIAGSRSLGLGRLITVLPKPNDGIVTVAETCLPGIADHLVVRKTHIGLVLSADTARQCIEFMRHGKFTRKI